MGAYPPGEHRVPATQGLVPERGCKRGAVVLLVASPGIVYKQIEQSGFIADAIEESFHGCIVGVIAEHRNASPAGRRHCVRGILDRAGEIVGSSAGSGATACNVDGGTDLAQGERDR